MDVALSLISAVMHCGIASLHGDEVTTANLLHATRSLDLSTDVDIASAVEHQHENTPLLDDI